MVQDEDEQLFQVAFSLRNDTDAGDMVQLGAWNHYVVAADIDGATRAYFNGMSCHALLNGTDSSSSSSSSSLVAVLPLPYESLRPIRETRGILRGQLASVGFWSYGLHPQAAALLSTYQPLSMRKKPTFNVEIDAYGTSLDVSHHPVHVVDDLTLTTVPGVIPTYTATVRHSISSITLRAHIDPTTSVSVSYSCPLAASAPNSIVLVSDVSSPWIFLPNGSSPDPLSIRLRSTEPPEVRVQSLYIIQRSPRIVNYIMLNFFRADNSFYTTTSIDTSQESMDSSRVVPYFISKVKVRVSFSVGDVHLFVNGTSVEYNLESGDYSNFIPLEPAGVTLLQVVSDMDGAYTIRMEHEGAIRSVDFVARPSEHVNTPTIHPQATPTWSKHIRNYNVTLSYMYTQLSFAITDWTGVVTFNWNDAAESSVAPASGQQVSQWFDVSVADVPFVLNVTSDLDGSYFLFIRRSNPDVQDILVLTDPPRPTTSVPFVAGTFNYSISVPFVVESISFQVHFNVATSLSLVGGGGGGGNNGGDGNSEAVVSGQPTTFRSIEVGPNSFILVSTMDGNYSIHIIRRDPCMNFGMASIGLLNAALERAPSSLTHTLHALSSSQRSYSSIVPFIWQLVNVYVPFDSEVCNVSWSMNDLPVGGEPLDPTRKSVDKKLDVASNLIRIQSDFDGRYTINLTRLSEDVEEIKIFVFADSDGTEPLGERSDDQVDASAPAGVLSATTLFVAFNVRSVRLAAWFDVAGSVSMSVSASDVDAAVNVRNMMLESGEPSNSVPLIVGRTIVTINSTQDGIRTIEITRGMPDSNIVAVEADGSDTLVASDFQVTMNVSTGDFMMSAPYAVDNIRLLASVQTDNNTIELISTSSMTTAPLPLQLSPSIPTSFNFSLLPYPQATTFLFNSSLDGAFTLSVHRRHVDLRDIQVSGETSFDPDRWPTTYPLLTSSLIPPFTPGIFEYGLKVPFVVHRVSFKLRFDVADSVVLTSELGEEPVKVTNDVYTAPLSALHSQSSLTTTLHLSSSQDGIYTLTVERLPPDLTNLSLFHRSGGGSPVAIPLSPSFQPGVVMEYEVSVPHSVASLAVSAIFGTATSVSLIVDDGQAANEQLQSNVLSVDFPLVPRPATNVWYVKSQMDGVITLRITRDSTNPCMNTAADTPPCQNGGECIPLNNSQYACSCPYGFAGVDCSDSPTDFTLPKGVTAPVAMLAGPNTVIGCDLVELDGRGSYGFSQFDEDKVTFEWRIESIRMGMDGAWTIFANQSTPLAPLYPFNETLGVTFGTHPTLNGSDEPCQTLLEIPASMLMDNVTYTFSLTIRVSSSSSSSSDIPPSTATVSVFKQVDDASIVPWRPQVHLHSPSDVHTSEGTTIFADILPSLCQPLPPDVTFNFDWYVRSSSSSTSGPDDQAEHDHDLLDGQAVFTSHCSRSLHIPPKTLVAGTSYWIELILTASAPGQPVQHVLAPGARQRRLLATESEVTMGSSTISVEREPLVARIIGGGYRQKSVDMPYTLDASTSYDPDWTGPPPPPYPFDFHWSATYVPNPNSNDVASSVPVTLPGGNASTLPQLEIPGDFFLDIVGDSTPILVTFTVTIRSADGCEDSESVRVEVLPKPTVPHPSVSIVNAPPSINPNQALTLTGALFSSITPTNELLLAWRCDSHPSLSLVDPNMIGTTPNSSNLIVRAGVLQPAEFYTFSLTATEPSYASTPHSVQSTAHAVVYANAPPASGLCSIYPLSGVALSTSFTIACKHWIDPQGLEPLSYAYAYFDTIADPDLRSPRLLSTSPRPSATVFESMLPAGELLVQVSVSNSAGATTVTRIHVSVTRPPYASDSPVCYVKGNSDTLLSSSISRQDGELSFLLIRELVSVLNTAGNDSSCTNLLYGGPADAVSASELRENLLDALTAVALTQSGDGTMSKEIAQLLSQSLVALTSDPDPMKHNATWHKIFQLVKLTIEAMPPGGMLVGANEVLTNNLAIILSNMLVDCAYLDALSSIIQRLLSAILHGTVANADASLLSTPNFQASTSRTNMEDRTYMTLDGGVTFTFTPDALVTPPLDPPLTAETVDTAAALNSVARDTRIVSLGDRWTHCRSVANANHRSGSEIVSELVSIDHALSNGDTLDMDDLRQSLNFLIPFNSASIQLDDRCYDTTGEKLAAQSSLLSCSFWDEDHARFSSDGCRNLGLTNDGTAVRCSCDHTGEFAILYHPSLSGNGASCTGEAAPIRSSFGASYWLVFFLFNLLVAMVSSFQLARIFRSSGCSGCGRHWLLSVEHALILGVALFRAWNHLNFYVFYPYLSLVQLIITRALPYLFTNWIFTFVIFGWARLYHHSTAAAAAGKREEKSLHRSNCKYQSIFIGLNSVVSLTLFTLLILMSGSSWNDGGSNSLYTAAVSIHAFVSLLYAIIFISYGLLLVRALTKDAASRLYGRQLLTYAIGFSLVFLASSLILFISVVGASSTFTSNVTTFTSIYFTLDLLMLSIVLALFSKSVSEAVRRQKKVHDVMQMKKSDLTTATATKMTTPHFATVMMGQPGKILRAPKPTMQTNKVASLIVDHDDGPNWDVDRFFPDSGPQLPRIWSDSDAHHHHQQQQPQPQHHTSPSPAVDSDLQRVHTLSDPRCDSDMNAAPQLSPGRQGRVTPHPCPSLQARRITVTLQSSSNTPNQLDHKNNKLLGVADIEMIATCRPKDELPHILPHTAAALHLSPRFTQSIPVARSSTPPDHPCFSLAHEAVVKANEEANQQQLQGVYASQPDSSSTLALPSSIVAPGPVPSSATTDDTPATSPSNACKSDTVQTDSAQPLNDVEADAVQDTPAAVAGPAGLDPRPHLQSHPQPVLASGPESEYTTMAYHEHERAHCPAAVGDHESSATATDTQLPTSSNIPPPPPPPVAAAGVGVGVGVVGLRIQTDLNEPHWNPLAPSSNPLSPNGSAWQTPGWRQGYGDEQSESQSQCSTYSQRSHWPHHQRRATGEFGADMDDDDDDDDGPDSESQDATPSLPALHHCASAPHLRLRVDPFFEEVDPYTAAFESPSVSSKTARHRAMYRTSTLPVRGTSTNLKHVHALPPPAHPTNNTQRQERQGGGEHQRRRSLMASISHRFSSHDDSSSRLSCHDADDDYDPRWYGVVAHQTAMPNYSPDLSDNSSRLSSM